MPVPAVVILLDPADDTGLIYNLILLALLLVFEPWGCFFTIIFVCMFYWGWDCCFVGEEGIDGSDL